MKQDSLTAVSARASFPLGPFTPYSENPILRPQGDGWESTNLYNPAAIVFDSVVHLLYRAHAADKVSRIGIATSADGLTFEREAAPVLVPEHDYESQGCEDPRVARINGTFYLTYTGFDGTRAQLCLATSSDLRHWTKFGPLFPGFNTWKTLPYGPDIPWSKAGVIYPEPIDGLYYMYFGEGAIYYATSTDLVTWTPCDNDSPIYTPTPGEWDSTLVEIGASPVATDDGLMVLLINGAHANSPADVDYRCGQIAIPLANPTRVVAKMTEPWLQPQTFEDTHGLVSNVTFVEGLVNFRGRWLAYYGQSDTTLAVAVFDPSEATSWQFSAD
jgi:beta-1,2-mannosidase